MALLPPCSVCYVQMIEMNKEVRSLIDTVHRLPINELKGGGPFSGEIDLTGGLTYSRTWSIMDYFIWEIPFTWSAYGSVFQSFFRMT